MQVPKSTCLSITCFHPKAPVSQDVCQEPDHLSIRDSTQQFESQAFVPDGVISGCQVNQDKARFSPPFKVVLDVAGDFEDLMCGTASFPETCLVVRQGGIWVQAG